MSALSNEVYLTPEEYLVRERESEGKNEYVNGLVVSMAGAKHRHNLVAGNLHNVIHNAFRDRPCIVYGSDMKVRVEQANLFRYTDISALCGPIDFYDEEEDVYSNPQFIGEVISKSTEVYDRGDKFALYRLIESFTEYLLVDPDEMRVERFVRQRGNRWAGETYGAAEDQVVLSSIQVSFSLAELYEKVEFPPADKG